MKHNAELLFAALAASGIGAQTPAMEPAPRLVHIGTHTRHPVLCNRAGLGEIPTETEDVATDVQIARNWKPGTIDEAALKRSATEAGFAK